MNETHVSIKVAAIQMVSSTNVDDNLNTAAQWIASAAKAGVQLVVLPEYFCFMGRRDTDKLALREIAGQGLLQDFLAGQAREHGLLLIGGTIPLESPHKDRIYNSSLVYGADGGLLARYDKIHLFGFQGNREAFSEADTIAPGVADAQTLDTPCGRVGLSVCYDLRFPELYRAMGDVSLIVVPSAFTWTTGQAHWEILLRARAIENQCYVLAAAQGGTHENGRRTWGHSVLIDPWGRVLDCIPENPGMVSGVIDPDCIRKVRKALPALTHRRM